jgi:phosphoribosylanthranilate isomerase
MAEIGRYRSAPLPPLGFLVDGYVAEFAGGAGVRADWRLATEIAAAIPILLAGGLEPDNVGEAIRQVRPLGVDVSSGVEIDGVKDARRIEAFIRAARTAFGDGFVRGRR